MKKPAIPESAIQKACLEYLRAKRIFAWRVNSGAVTATYNGKTRFVRFNGMPGMSDICGVLPDGRFLAVEVKREGGKTTPDQQTFLESVTKTGGLAIVVHSVDELDQAIREAA